MSDRNQRPIALFSPTLGGGGAEKVLVNLACGMIDQVEAIDIVVGQATALHTSHIPQQARLVDLRASRTLCSIFPLTEYMRESRPRAMICFQDHATVVALWARALARVPLPIVGTVHTTWSRCLATGTVKTRVLAWCARQAYARVESVVAVSNGAADNLAATLNLPREKIRVIYNPVIGPDLFARSKAVLEHPWFAPGCQPVIIGIGRLTQPKDFQTLVLAFAQVRRHIDCRLMILGEGEERASLAALATATGFGDDIALPGFVDNPYKYLVHSSLFVLSSIWEGLPTVLIEALALGVPVVSTDCDNGPREILENGLHGRLVRPADPSALAEAMRQTLLQKPAPSGGMQRFYQDRVTQQYRALVDEISQ
jgi:glycosyltransferase involved in cell wall biosynthesis